MAVACDLCGGPCKLEDWERDTSFIQNNPEKARAKIFRVHARLKPEHAAEVERVRAQIRAVPESRSYACSRCERFAFPEPTVCLWCRGQPPAPTADQGEPDAERHPSTPKLLSTRQKRRIVDNQAPPELGLFGGT